MRRIVPLLCALLLCGALVAPAAARPPPRDVSGFAGGLGGDSLDYPASTVTNVTVDVAVHANATSTWTERATLTNPDTADALRANDTLRRAVATGRFAHRFGRDTDALHARVRGDALTVTYRLDGGVARAPGGGLVFAPFADYRNDYRPGDADVTIRAPDGYRVVDHPDAMAVADDGATLRWNASTGAGDAGVSPGLVTLAPANAVLSGARADLAVLATYGLPSFGVGVAYALLFGLPLGVVGSGTVALAGARRVRVVSVGFACAALVGLGAAVASYPATGSVVAGALHPFFLTLLALPLALAATALGVGLHAVARWRA
ncbi:hypothetical protein J2752_002317 [Halarchaeum rubridurum]|uniref:Uncharacterized protein n=1 Tax=Halarchaeum rubridurum TaxID=489911 RepID=A0A830G267_9EURY|nr:hypothetical protein [Halarchaeum rubridurum]MBP1955394.1 hypothetical protein [Halarchaeum rubridurum]GGM72062.1 hypothetical protein GCM10009017_22480 [Halarchaeum rubridurum]